MQNFSEYVTNLKRKIRVSKEETIFVCIGSNDVVWDSIGPNVGSFLKKNLGEKYVIGDLQRNICNQKDLKIFYPKMRNKFIIAIDSAITENFLVGEIFITDEPIIMGQGINRNKGLVGDVGIKASISKNVINKKFVMHVSKIIADGICNCYNGDKY